MILHIVMGIIGLIVLVVGILAVRLFVKDLDE